MTVRITRLSKRENEVVDLLLEGKSNKQIAYALGISERTVEFHLKNVDAKYEVSSRVELILRLLNVPGKDLGEPTDSNLWISTVVTRVIITENRLRYPVILNRLKAFKGTILIYGEETEMKKRWILYILAGLVFGAVFWHYFTGMAHFFSNFPGVDNPVMGFFLLIPVLAVYFGVRLLPAIFPALSEYRHSSSIRTSILAGIIVFVSAVLGYYLNYVAMLAFVGLPNMDHLLIHGILTPAQWQEWNIIFPQLIISKMIKWLILGVLIGGLAGFLTIKIYSMFVAKQENLPTSST